MTYTVFLIIYALVVFGAVFVAIQWLKSKRRPKLPFKPEGEKLLRGPGESLKRKIELMDENQIFLLVALMILPVLAGSSVLAVLHQVQFNRPGASMVLALIAAVAVLGVGSWYLAKEAIRRGNHYLGWFGERMTAAELDPLRERGWRVFHDMPAESGKQEFNIDHVVIGPGGVFSIETKMRRQGGTRPGRKDHELLYDGKTLNWPWGEDSYGLAQAERNSTWLRDWLSLMTGERLEVTPILVFPGWHVTPSDTAPRVNVINTRDLESFIGQRNEVLTPTQIDLLSRQLESRCRDVVY